MKILRRIQFKLSNRSEFTSLTNFCIAHFGAVRDLHNPPPNRTSTSTTLEFSPPGPPSTSYFNYYAASQSSPPHSTPSTTGRRVGWSTAAPPSSQRRPASSAWIPKSSQPLRSVTRMLDDMASQGPAPSVADEPVKHVPPDPVVPVVEKPFEITETIMLCLLEDETFVAEVVAVARLWDKMGLTRRLFSVDL